VSRVNPHEQAKGLVLQILPAQTVTEEQLEESVDRVLDMVQGMHPDFAFGRDLMIRELQAVLSIFQPDAVSLDDPTGHEEWFRIAQDEIEWRFWNRYVRYLQEETGLPPAVIDRLDKTTSRILGKLEDPSRRGAWDRRGMVVGQIQSGKTGNYTGLICRAADAGYKLIVVLAGMHNNLRSQTQLRLDSGFLGFDTQKRPQAQGDDASFMAAAMGVGRLTGGVRLHAASLTDSADNGDFLVRRANSLGLMIGGDPVLLVVKKHRGILDNFREWVLDTHASGDTRLVRQFPVFVIDDEADNASLNTNDPTDPSGAYSDDLEPSRVNGAIRQLLNAFEKKAYVGYTATPFANLYIPDDLDHAVYGRDLFPSSFIEYLRPPSNYFGPARLFGLDGEVEPLPLYRPVTDHQTWVPDRHRADLRVGALPDSLKTAIRCFILARAARLARGQERAHNSMLVHVTRLTAVQSQVREQVDEELTAIRGRIKFGDGDGADIRDELRQLWFADFVPTSAAVDGPDPLPDWERVETFLLPAAEPIEIKTINGTAQDTLEYFEHRDTGLNVIAIGGAKLSRGLTLEGLTVSYYLRTTQAADTLLQMGRWFGYREGYEDLCRLWTTPQLWQSFHEVTAANEELIHEFEEMASRGATPADYGLKVANSVAGMIVTAANKMRAGTRLRVGFSEAISETVSLHCDPVTAEANLQIADSFIALLDREYGAHQLKRGNLLWTGVSGLDVADEFFAHYRSPEGAWRVQAPVIADYVRNRVGAQELTGWTVALISNTTVTDPLKRRVIGGHDIGLTQRDFSGAVSKQKLAEGLYSIRRILSPTDEGLDFTDAEEEEALVATIAAWEANGRQYNGKAVSEPTRPSGIVLRRRRPVTRGLLMIYPLEPPAAQYRVYGTLTDGPMLGFAVSFPRSPDAPAMDYVVNRQFLRELLADEE
jgi:hypothetical protein